MRLDIGLTAAKETYRTEDDPNDRDKTAQRPVDGNRVLTVHFPDDTPITEAIRTVTDTNGVVANHTDGQPAWVHSDDNPALAQVLADHYHVIAGAPADLEDTHWTEAGPPGTHPVTTTPQEA